MEVLSGSTEASARQDGSTLLHDRYIRLAKWAERYRQADELTYPAYCDERKSTFELVRPSGGDGEHANDRSVREYEVTTSVVHFRLE